VTGFAVTDLTETSIATEQLLDGHLLKVYRDRVRLPDGTESIREWIDHPGASAVVPLLSDGTVVLVRQYRFPSRRVFLEIPAGKLDPGDTDPADAARRELEEETGWRAGRLEHLGSLSNCIGYSNEVIHLYLARDLVPGRARLAEGEHLEVVRMPFADVVSMARAGHVEDMKTASAVLLAACRLDETG
jgi:ADP-ribose pyrophosphatase